VTAVQATTPFKYKIGSQYGFVTVDDDSSRNLVKKKLVCGAFDHTLVKDIRKKEELRSKEYLIVSQLRKMVLFQQHHANLWIQIHFVR
jgi:hypothetical protein